MLVNVNDATEVNCDVAFILTYVARTRLARSFTNSGSIWPRQFCAVLILLSIVLMSLNSFRSDFSSQDSIM